MSEDTDPDLPLWDRLILVMCEEMEKRHGVSRPKSPQSRCSADIYLDVRDRLVEMGLSWCSAHVFALDAVAVFARGCASGSLAAMMLLNAHPERPI